MNIFISYTASTKCNNGRYGRAGAALPARPAARPGRAVPADGTTTNASANACHATADTTRPTFAAATVSTTLLTSLQLTLCEVVH